MDVLEMMQIIMLDANFLKDAALHTPESYNFYLEFNGSKPQRNNATHRNLCLYKTFISRSTNFLIPISKIA